MKEEIKQLFSLCTLPGISGREDQVTEAVAKEFKRYVDQVTVDRFGSVCAVMNPGAPRQLLFEAHLDEIGLMVRAIDKQGFVQFVTVGGIDPGILPSASVVIHGAEQVKGVIGAKPPHLQKAGESDKGYKIEDLFIDTGYTKAQLEQKIAVGDAVTFLAPPQMLQGSVFATKSVDNRAGVQVLLECMKRLKNANLDVQITFLAAVQEEVGGLGSQTAAFREKPGRAVIVDVTHGISPYTQEGENAFPLNSGAAICMSPVLDKPLSRTLIQHAKERQIPYTIEVSGGATGTDADSMQVAGTGVPCAVVSVPIRYMHTTVETCDYRDIEAIVDLLCALAEQEGGAGC